MTVVSLFTLFCQQYLSYLSLDDFEAVSAVSSESGSDDASVSAVSPTPALAPVLIAPATPVAPAPAPIAGPSNFVDPSTCFYVVFVGRRVGVYSMVSEVCCDQVLDEY